MLTWEDREKFRKEVLGYYQRAGIVLNEEEKENIEIADFGLNDYRRIGLAIVVYVHCDRYSSEEMVLLPGQICPEHRHPPVVDPLGKQETFRCRMGTVYLYVEGEPSDKQAIKARLPVGKENTFTVFHEILLRPGEQYTILPNTLHWFQAGAEGAIISEFSSFACDEADIFTDPAIIRKEDGTKERDRACST